MCWRDTINVKTPRTQDVHLFWDVDEDLDTFDDTDIRIHSQFCSCSYEYFPSPCSSPPLSRVLLHTFSTFLNTNVRLSKIVPSIASRHPPSCSCNLSISCVTEYLHSCDVRTVPWLVPVFESVNFYELLE